jgi:hypothetical protein
MKMEIGLLGVDEGISLNAAREYEVEKRLITVTKPIEKELFYQKYAQLHNKRATLRVNANKFFEWLTKNEYVLTRATKTHE